MAQKVQSMVSGPEVGQNIMVEGHSETKLLSSWQPESKIRVKKTEGQGPGIMYSPWSHAPCPIPFN